MVSLIIPIYNSSETLNRCLSSVKRQSYCDYEVIMVDDGSTDDSFELCRSFGNEDSRFIVINQENGGASSARNTGIENAHGDYICFVDSDDEIRPNYIKDLIDDIGEYDIVIHGMMHYHGASVRDMRMKVNGQYDLTTDYQSFFHDINIDEFGGPVCKLFKKSIIDNNNLRFNTDIRLAEDLDFFMRYLCCCKSVKTADRNNYSYIAASGSASVRVYSYETEMSGLLALNKSWSALLDKFYCETLKERYERSISCYVCRIIPSIFEKKTSVGMHIAQFKKIEDKFIAAYEKWYRPETTFMSLQKYLLCRRWFVLLDMILRFRFYVIGK